MSSRTAARIAVLMGGRSAEREVSLVSGRECAAALRQEGFAVVEIDAGPDLASALTAAAPDVAFNALHGRWGEDGCVQGILEWLAHPLHPFRRARLGAGHGQDPRQARSSPPPGCRSPQGVLVCRDARARPRTRCRRPTWSSRTTRARRSASTWCCEGANGPAQLADDMPEMVLVEEYVAGRELTTTVMGDRALAVTDIIADGWYDYHAKYAPGGSRHVVPARDPGGDRGGLPRLCAARPPGARLPRRQPHRLPLGRGEGPRRADPARDQHPARHDPDLARPRAGGAPAASRFGALVRWMVEDASCSR